MPRSLLLVLAALLAAAIGALIAIYGGLAPLGEMLPLLASDATARIATGVVAAALTFMLCGLTLPMLADALALGGSAVALRGLVGRRAAGRLVAPAAFIACFRGVALRREAEAFAARLWLVPGEGETAEDAETAWHSGTDFAELTAPAERGRRAMGSVVARLWLTLIALGGLSLLALSSSPRGEAIGDEVAALAPLAPLALAALAAALLLYLFGEALTLLRLQLIGDIVGIVRQLFPRDELAPLLDRLARNVASSDAARRTALESATETVNRDLEQAVRSLRSLLGGHDRRIALSVGAAVERMTQPIATSIETMLSRVETEQGGKSERLLQAVLGEFLGQFDARFADQMQEIGRTLAATRQLVDELGQALAEGVVSLQAQTRATLTDAADGQSQLMRGLVGELGENVQRTTVAIEGLGRQTEGALATWAERTEELVSGIVSRSTAELSRTAGAFNQLHAILETLSVSVLPAINRLVQTQERLHGAVDRDQTNAAAFARAAQDLGEAAKIAREMVERQLLLTRELAQAGHATPAMPAPARAAEGGVSGLARAIEDLRSAADDELKSLPRL